MVANALKVSFCHAAWIWTVTPVADRPTEDKLFQRICKWLGDVSFNSIYSESLAKGTEGTGMWFIESQAFQRWAEGDLQILWGTGKREPFKFY